jgi:hypothetical protein
MSCEFKRKIKIAGSILLGIGILAFYLWVIIGPDIKVITDEYKLITGKKALVAGKIVEAEKIEEEVEKDAKGQIEMVQGYSYKYTFRTINNKEISAHGWNYGELPLDKSLDDIPYDIKVEYLVDNPSIYRINGLWSDNTSLFAWFRRLVLFRLLGFLFFIFIVYTIIRRAVVRNGSET